MLRPEPEGGFTVIVPSLTGCITYGETLREAKEMAKEAIELYLESLAAHNSFIP